MKRPYPIPANAATSWLCENGYHGTEERREPFTYQGTCARKLQFADGSTADCVCECHSTKEATK